MKVEQLVFHKIVSTKISDGEVSALRGVEYANKKDAPLPGVLENVLDTFSWLTSLLTTSSESKSSHSDVLELGDMHVGLDEKTVSDTSSHSSGGRSQAGSSGLGWLGKTGLLLLLATSRIGSASAYEVNSDNFCSELQIVGRVPGNAEGDYPAVEAQTDAYAAIVGQYQNAMAVVPQYLGDYLVTPEAALAARVTLCGSQGPAVDNMYLGGVLAREGISRSGDYGDQYSAGVLAASTAGDQVATDNAVSNIVDALVRGNDLTVMLPPTPYPTTSPSAGPTYFPTTATFSPSPSPTFEPTFSPTERTASPSASPTGSPTVKIDVPVWDGELMRNMTCQTTIQTLTTFQCSTQNIERLVAGYQALGCGNVTGAVSITCNPDGSNVRLLTAGDPSDAIQFHITGLGIPGVLDDHSTELSHHASWLQTIDTSVRDQWVFAGLTTAILGVGAVCAEVHATANSRLTGLAKEAIGKVTVERGTRHKDVIRYAGNPEKEFKRVSHDTPAEVFTTKFVAADLDKTTAMGFHDTVEDISINLASKIQGAGSHSYARAAADTIVLALVTKLQQVRGRAVSLSEDDLEQVRAAVDLATPPSYNARHPETVGGALGMGIGGAVGATVGYLFGGPVAAAAAADGGLIAGGMLGGRAGRSLMNINLDAAFIHIQTIFAALEEV